MREIDRRGRMRSIWLPAVLVAFMLAACRPEATATPRLAEGITPEALRSPTSRASGGSRPEQATLEPPSPSPSSLPAAIGAYPLPARLAQIPLAPAGEKLASLAIDSDGSRLYVLDSTGTLHVVDTGACRELASLPVTGGWDPQFEVSTSLLLDAAQQRLYVAAQVPPDGAVTVVDTAALRVVGSITPGGTASLDAKRGRLYVGRGEHDTPPYAPSYAPLTQPSGKVYEAQTLSELGDLPVKGKPVYDPLADELLIVSFTVYRVDPDTLEVTGDLLPDISEQPCPECSGVLFAGGAQVDPGRNLLRVQMGMTSAGHPAACMNDRYFNATTLEPIPDPSITPPFEPTCNGRRKLTDSVRERAYASLLCDKYVDYRTLLVYAPDGAKITTLDGMALGVVNPNTCQSYVTVGERVVVLDLPALAPVGALPPADYTLDAKAGRLYGLAGADLLVFAEQGGRPEAPPPAEVTDLPAGPITFIRPSPDYASDRTVLISVAHSLGYPFNTLYRSTDGGKTWAILHGGLPQEPFVALDLAVSPGFAADHTLFAGGFRGSMEGLGVFRSTDGGDTWQPMSEGLGKLKVDALAISPDYARDGTLLAYTSSGVWDSSMGWPIYRSTDRGQHWTLAGDGRPPSPDLLPPGPSGRLAQFRLSPSWPGTGGGVDRWTASTRTWHLVFSADSDDGVPVAVLPSPTIDDRTVYVLTHTGLWQSTDLGETWKRCPRARLDARQSANRVTAGALVDSRLFVGTAAGEFFSMDVTKQPCQPVETANRWPTVLAGEHVRRIEVAPADWAGPGDGGDVWLATEQSGVYRYGDGAVQAHFAPGSDLRSRDIWGLALVPHPSAVWAAGQNPLDIASFDGEAWTAHTPDLSGPFPWVVDIAAGQDGTVWAVAVLSTDGLPHGVLLRWTGSQWEQIDDPEHVLDSLVYDVAVAPDGSVWVATQMGTARYSRGAFTFFELGECHAVAFDPGGEVYAATFEGRVWRYAGGSWTTLPPLPSELRGLGVLYVARDGAIWIATVDGVARYDGRAWRNFTQSDGMPGGTVECIVEDAAGRFWFGTSNGAIYVDPGSLGLSAVSW